MGGFYPMSEKELDYLAQPLIKEAAEILTPAHVSLSISNHHDYSFSACIHRWYPYAGIRFSLAPMPGSEDYVISYFTNIYGAYQGKGLARHVMAFKEEFVRAQHFRGLICTVNSGNEIEKHILGETGWAQVHSVNPQVVNGAKREAVIELWAKELKSDNPNNKFAMKG